MKELPKIHHKVVITKSYNFKKKKEVKINVLTMRLIPQVCSFAQCRARDIIKVICQTFTTLNHKQGRKGQAGHK